MPPGPDLRPIGSVLPRRGRYRAGVLVRCWSDYLCPWCYVGLGRDALFAEAGFEIVHLPYELHPEIGPEGRRVRPDGRLRTTFDRIEAECDRIGMEFRRPTRMPNTRRALLTAEAVRRRHPEAFDETHRGLFRAQFVHGDPLDDPDVLDAIVTAAGAEADSVRDAVDAGEIDPHLEASHAEARAAGVASTPTWLIGELAVPGAVDDDTLRRWLDRLAGRSRS